MAFLQGKFGPWCILLELEFSLVKLEDFHVVENLLMVANALAKISWRKTSVYGGEEEGGGFLFLSIKSEMLSSKMVNVSSLKLSKNLNIREIVE